MADHSIQGFTKDQRQSAEATPTGVGPAGVGIRAMKQVCESDPLRAGGVAAGDPFDAWKFGRSRDKRYE
jgi:hypothetical protein